MPTLKIAELLLRPLDLGKSRLATSAMIYLASYLISLGVPFLLLPIMTQYIDPDGYGRLAMLQMLLSIAGVIIVFSLRHPLIQAASVGDRASLGRFISASLWVASLMCLLLLVAALAMNRILDQFTGLSTGWIALTVLAALGLAINQFNLAAMQATHRPTTYAATHIGFSLLNLSAAVFLVVALNMGWSGRALAIIIVTVLSGVWGIGRFLKDGLLRKVGRTDVWHVLTFGAAAMPHMISSTLQIYSDRILLGLFFTFADIGIYTVASHMAQGFVACSEAVNLALEPWIYRQLDSMGNRIALSRMAAWALALILFAAVMAALYYFAMALLGRLLLPPTYSQAFAYFTWLLPAACFQGLFNTFAAVLFHYKHKRALSVLGVFGLVSAGVLIYLLARTYGPIGIAMGILVNRILLLLLVAGTAMVLLRHHSKTQGGISGMAAG